MPFDIDELQIKIESDVKGASKGIDNLVQKLDVLSSSMKNFDSKGLQKFSSGVNMLISSMHLMKDINMSVFTRAQKGIKKFEEIDGSKLATVSNAIVPLANGLNALSGITFDGKNMTNFVNAVSGLANSNVQNINSANFQQLGRSINTLANSLSNARTVQSNTIQMVNSVARLANAGEKARTTSTSLPLLSVNLTNLIRSMSKSPLVAENTIQFANAIGVLASAGNKAQATANNLSILAIELKNFFKVMSTAPSVNSNVIQMTQALGNLASHSRGTGNATRSLARGFNLYSSSAKTASKNTFSLASAIGKAYATYWMLFRAFGLIRKSMNISSDLVEVQNVVDHVFGDMKYKVEDLAKESIKQFGMSELALKQYSSRFQAMGTAMGITAQQVYKANEFVNKNTGGYIGLSDSLADVSLGLTKLTADMASFYNVSQDAVAQDLESVFTGQTRPLRTYGLDLTEATLKEFAMRNGLNANIDAMTQAEKTMLRYQYVLANTTAAQGDFARTSNTYANQIRILKEQFVQLGGIAGQAGVNLTLPIIQGFNKAMGAAIDFTQTVVNSLGVIFGWKLQITDVEDTYDGVSDIVGEIADGTGVAADNAKKLRQQLQKVDELNVLTSDKDNNKGIAGAIDNALGATGSNNKKYEIVESESIFESDLDTLYKLGDHISETLREQLESIDWDSVYEGGRNFGHGLADFLNGLINVDTFGVVGKTIANSLNTAVYTALEFGETFDFEKNGEAIANGINEFFVNFDFIALAQTLNVWANGLKESTIKAIKEIKWTDVIGGAFDFLTELELDTIVIIGIGKFILSGKAKELALKKLGAMLGLEIGTPQLTIAAVIGLISFKIGNFLSKNKIISDLTDQLTEWLFNGDETIDIDRAIAVILSGLTIGFGAAKLFGKLYKSLSGKTLTEAVNNNVSSMIPSSPITISKAIKVLIAIEVAKQVADKAYDVGRNFAAWIAEKTGHDDMAEYYRKEGGKKNVASYLPWSKDENAASLKEWFNAANEGLKDFNKAVRKDTEKLGKTLLNIYTLGLYGALTKTTEFKRTWNNWAVFKLKVGLASKETAAYISSKFSDTIKRNSDDVTTAVTDTLVTRPQKNLILKSEDFRVSAFRITQFVAEGITQGESNIDNALNRTITNSGEKNFTDNRWEKGGAVLASGVTSGVINGWIGVQGALSNKIQSTKFDSTNWYSGGTSLVNSTANGINNNWGKIDTIVNSRVYNTGITSLAGWKWESAGRALTDGAYNGINAEWGVIDWLTNYKINNTASGIFTVSQWYKSGINLVQGLQNGIENKWSGSSAVSLQGKILSLASGLTKTLNKAFQIHSPSRLWRKTGNFLTEGLELGVTDDEKSLMNTVASMGYRLTDTMADSIELASPSSILSDNFNVGVKNTMEYQHTMAGNMSSDIAQSVKNGVYSAQYEQNMLLREQNNLLYQILQKKTGITEDELYNAVVNKNRSVYDSTGYTPLMV